MAVETTIAKTSLIVVPTSTPGVAGPKVEDSLRVYRPVGSFYESTIRRIVDRRLVETPSGTRGRFFCNNYGRSVLNCRISVEPSEAVFLSPRSEVLGPRSEVRSPESVVLSPESVVLSPESVVLSPWS